MIGASLHHANDRNVKTEIMGVLLVRTTIGALVSLHVLEERLDQAVRHRARMNVTTDV